jgi:glucokinase
MAPDPPVLGVDVGGTKVAVAALEGATAKRVVQQPTVLSSTAELLDGIEACVREMIEETTAPAAIGVGVPSQIDYDTGTVETSVNIPLAGVPLRDELSGRFGVPVFVDNDANCAALAEAQLVDNPPARNLVMLTLGTGVGGGVVIDGKIFRGANGLGAELGHFPIEAEGPLCPGNCPNRGCVEALCSGTALERDATEQAKDLPDTRLGRLYAENGEVTGHDVVAAAEDGDTEALLLFERFGRYVGVAIAGYVNVFQPEIFVIGGGLSRASDLFLERALGEAATRALPALWKRTSVSLARGGADAGVIGAGLLAAQEIGRDTPRSASLTSSEGRA